MNLLFLDVETTGLPGKDLNWEKDYLRFPRIVSIAWRLSLNHEAPGALPDELLEDCKPQYFIINQRGKSIPPAAIKIHRITDEMCARSGHHFQLVLKEFIQVTLQAELIIGHNLYFDTSILKANVLREFGPGSKEAKEIIQGLDKHKRRDIMRRSASFNKGYISLEKLYLKLFGEAMEGKAHNALCDIRALEKCFYKLLELEAITI